jgi:hypothetical protein
MIGETHIRVTLMRCGRTMRTASTTTTIRSGSNCTHPGTSGVDCDPI